MEQHKISCFAESLLNSGDLIQHPCGVAAAVESGIETTGCIDMKRVNPGSAKTAVDKLLNTKLNAPQNNGTLIH